MKTRILLSTTVAIALISPPALAASQHVTINDLAIANGRLTVKVPAGDGVVVDLTEVGQTVTGVSFGDPTKFVISAIDGQLCYMQQEGCEATGASLILFRQVKNVEITTQSHSPDGSTTVTLITDGKLGRKILHMRLTPAVKATYTAIVVRENSPPVLLATTNKTSTRRTRLVSTHTSTTLPIQPLQTKPVGSSPMALKPKPKPEVKLEENFPIALPISLPVMEFLSSPSDAKKIEVRNPAVVAPKLQFEQSTKKPTKSPVSYPPVLIGSTMQKSDANALAVGLSMANPNRNNSIKIAPRSAQYKKVQTAIIVLREGRTRGEAAKASGLKLQFVEQLINLGR